MVECYQCEVTSEVSWHALRWELGWRLSVCEVSNEAYLNNYLNLNISRNWDNGGSGNRISRSEIGWREYLMESGLLSVCEVFHEAKLWNLKWDDIGWILLDSNFEIIIFFYFGEVLSGEMDRGILGEFNFRGWRLTGGSLDRVIWNRPNWEV